MDKETREQFVQEIKEFMSKPVYDWVRNEYNKRMIKRLEDLHKSTSIDTELHIRYLGGEISGYKNGFDILEKLVEEAERKEE